MKHNGPDAEEEGESELMLIRQAASGDQQAFHDLICSYERGLQTYLTKMLGNWETAQDIVQETFITLFHSLPTWHPPVQARNDEAASVHVRPLYPWLYRIATNRALSHLRKQTVRNRIHAYTVHELSSQQEDLQQTHLATDQPSPEEHYIARELLTGALRQLPEDDALCLVLHYVNGDRYEEIAVRLGVSKEAVRKRVNRALIALRKVYHNLDSEVHL